MTIGISHKDLSKLRSERKIKKVGNRKNRTSTLSQKSRAQTLKEFEMNTPPKAKTLDIEIDEHVKMNDNYMRTGKYVPKKK